MKIQRLEIGKLLRWLKKHNIELVEDRLQADGSRVLMFSTELPGLPFGDRHVWCPLVIKPGQFDVSHAEIEALLRHCWHGELEIPEDYD